MKAIRFRETGGPEVLSLEDIDLPQPKPGQARVRHTAVGLNFIDTYQRNGLYPVPMPSGLGMEAAGVVEAVGDGVTDVRPGMRVGYAGGGLSAYSEAANVAADRLVPLPDWVSDEEAAAVMLKGLTVQYLLRQTYPVREGETILFHAAAGGVGLIACQWAKHLGVTVIGTVSSDEKAELARAHGCHHVIVYSRENFVERVLEITNGEKVPVVYDAVGATTFDGSLDCLRPRGMMVSFGNASGPPPPFNLLVLSQKGSLFLTRPTLFHYTATRDELLAAAADLFEVMRSGAVKVEIHQRYPLAEAAQAHRDLEGRKTTGSTVLLP
jgi:NADPH2:quinone reductase